MALSKLIWGGLALALILLPEPTTSAAGTLLGVAIIASMAGVAVPGVA